MKKEGFYHQLLSEFLKQLDSAVEKNWDGLFYMGGMEGSGKTTLALQIAKKLDPNFKLDNVVFNGEEFVDACVNAKKKQCIVFDESYNVFNNRNFANKLTNKIITMLTMIRSKQLFIIIVSPTFFDLSKYLIMHRSRCFINVYAKDMKRGFFAFYNFDKKNQLYIRGKKNHDMTCVLPLFRGTFGNWSPIDLSEYEERKQNALRKLAEDKSKTEIPPEKIINKEVEDRQLDLINYLRSKRLLKFGALQHVNDFFGISYKAFDCKMRKIQKDKKPS